MPSSILVVPGADAIAPKVLDGAGTYSDLVGSKKSAEHPLIVGVWNITDTETPRSWQAGWDEMKYVVRGEAEIKDEWTGSTHVLRPGTLLWIPKGAKVSVLRSKDCATIYTEQMYRDADIGTGEVILPSSSVLEGLHQTLLAQYIAFNPQSEKAFRRAKNSIPGGTTRSVLHSSPFPLVIKSGREAWVTSIDGREYLDFVSDYSAGLLGHSHPAIEDAMTQAIKNGFSLGAVTEKEAELGEAIQQRFPSIELVRFCNSGTEANAYALAAATAYTGRKKVLVFDKGYHGGVLNFGIRDNPLNLPHDYVYGEYNDIESTRKVLTHELAAILVEPLQSAGGIRPASDEFLSFLRNAADTFGCLLIFDEIVTSRLHINGLQGLHGLTPDMTTLGKYIGGGFSFGAFGGKREIMQQFDPSGTDRPLSHSGTFNNNVFTMTAAVAAAKVVTKEAIDKANALGARVLAEAGAIFEGAGFAGISLTGYGSAVGFQFESGEEGFLLRESLYYYLIGRGIQIGRRGFVFFSFSHKDAHVDALLEGIHSFVAECR